MTIDDAINCIEIQKSREQGNDVRHKRKILDFYNQPERRWPMPIVYKYAGEQSEYQKGVNVLLSRCAVSDV